MEGWLSRLGGVGSRGEESRGKHADFKQLGTTKAGKVGLLQDEDWGESGGEAARRTGEGKEREGEREEEEDDKEGGSEVFKEGKGARE